MFTIFKYYTADIDFSTQYTDSRLESSRNWEFG